MKSQRQKKVEGIIQEELAEIINRKINTGGSLITVSQVDVTPDLGNAKIFISIFPPQNREEIFLQLEQQQNYIRKLLGNQLSQVMRIIPELHFKLDTTLDNVEQLDKELKGKGDNPIL